MRQEYEALRLTPLREDLIEEKMKLGYEVKDFLLKNLVQARYKSSLSTSQEPRYTCRILERHEMATNTRDAASSTCQDGKASYTLIKPITECLQKCPDCTCST